MKNMIQYYKLLFIICLITISNAEILKPSNEKYEIVKITDEKNKTRTYFHLNDREQLIFENLLDFVTDKNAKYGVKIISRAKISPNSNSSKTFGIVLEIQEEDNRMVKELKYKKGSSAAKKSTKSGFNYTQGGFWFTKLIDLENTKILIKKMEGSPEVDVRVVIDEIKLRSSDKIIKPVNQEKSYKIFFLKSRKDTSHIKTLGWNNLKTNSTIQYKVEGPMQLRVLTRSTLSDEFDDYNFIIRENGRFMGDYEYYIKPSRKDAHCFMDKKKISLSNYNSFFINVPNGVNYYSIETTDEQNQNIETADEDEETQNIFIKLQSYILK